MQEDGAATKDLLLDAAELLMAEHGIEGAELSDIHRLAGQRNRSAIAYHFGDREGLVRAMAVRRRAPVNRVRNRMLDRLERDGRVTVPTLVDAMVRPPAVDLRTAGGRRYLIVLAEAATRLGSTNLLVVERTDVDSMHRLGAHLFECLPGSAARRRRTVSRAVLVAPILLADIAREIDHGEVSERQIGRRVSEVVDFISTSMCPPWRPPTGGPWRP